MNRHSVGKVALVLRDNGPVTTALSRDMEAWLTARGIHCSSLVYNQGASGFRDAVAGVDLVIVLGGDGTLVGAARKLASAPLPILGVNLGKVGFLAEVAPESWEKAFTRMIEAGVRLESSVVLGYVLVRDGEILWQGPAVNDVVVSRGGPARLVSFFLTLDDIRLAAVRADGLIVSTPTGSTGYSSSAGGPLLHPGLNAFAVTPICPFMSTFPPMVVAGETRLSVTVDAAGPGIHLSVDGQESLELQHGDRLETTGRPDGILFARIDDEGYFAKLRSAGFMRDFAE